MLRNIPVALASAAVAAIVVNSSQGTTARSGDGSLPPTSTQQVVLTPSSTAEMRTAPDGTPVASVRSGAQLVVLARERGWVRVRAEGWIAEGDLVAADSMLRMSPSAADIRADPDGMKGRVVQWDVEFIALQRADPLRRDMTPDEWYILGRGPGDEGAIIYLVVPDALRGQVEALPPLTRIQVIARVRVGRGQPMGVPILDIESLMRR